MRRLLSFPTRSQTYFSVQRAPRFEYGVVSLGRTCIESADSGAIRKKAKETKDLGTKCCCLQLSQDIIAASQCWFRCDSKKGDGNKGFGPQIVFASQLSYKTLLRRDMWPRWESGRDGRDEGWSFFYFGLACISNYDVSEQWNDKADSARTHGVLEPSQK